MSKAPDAFRTISEVAEFLETPAHVLRFWESRFPQIKPVKRAGGRRYYRPADLALLSGIRRLLHDEGMTIRGVQKILREQGVRHVSGLSEEEEADLESIEMAEVVEEVVPSSEPIPLFPKPVVTVSPDLSEAEQEDVVDDAQPFSDTAAALPEPVPHENPDPHLAAPVANDSMQDDAVQDAVEPDPAPPMAEIVTEPDLASSSVDDPPVDAAAETQIAPSEFDEAATVKPESDQPDLFAPLAPPIADAQSLDLQDAEAEDSPQIDVAELDAEPLEDDVWAALSGDDEPGKAPLAATEDLSAPDQAGLSAPEVQDSTPPERKQKARPSVPLPSLLEISGHWLPADLRALRQGALVEKREQTAALIQRLETLRNRVGDLGRVPRR